jgi:alginate O-acetyltransferase complex protein AlgI
VNFTQLSFFVLTGIALFAVAATNHSGFRKYVVLTASFIFYGWWDWRFLGLLLVSTTIDFLAGLLVDSAKKNGDLKTAKLGITIAIAANLAILGVFKYFDFFTVSAAAALAAMGIETSPVVLQVILPIGISFYSFHAISYAVDVYRGETEVSRNYLDYLNFVMFFPQLVAGPIARASHLLPQVTKGFHVTTESIYSGSQLFLFGLVKKLLIADRLGPIVDLTFGNPNSHFLDVLISGLAFMCQIYCDFSGYTDMARGTARMFGISLADNFKFPFLVANPRDFWRNWHISLSSWLRDYLFIPIGGSMGTFLFVARNLMITMVLGGLWHGASWNFVIWGAYHGALLVAHRAYSERGIGERIKAVLGSPAYGAIAWTTFAGLTLFGWIIFRCSQSTQQLKSVLNALRHSSFAHEVPVGDAVWVLSAFLIVCILQLWQKKYGPEPWQSWGISLRTVAYASSFIGLAWLTKSETNPFIYFQF